MKRGRIVRQALISGLAGGLMSAAVSALLNYHVLPMPQSVADNAVGHGFGGFFSGFFSAFVAVLAFMLHQRARSKGAAT